MDAREQNILLSRLIPLPQQISFQDGSSYLLQKDSSIVLDLPVSLDPCSQLASLAQSYWQCEPHITLRHSERSRELPPEGYSIQLSPSELLITAADLAGVLHAFKTLRQLAEPQRGTLTVSGYLLPPCTIQDHPASSFRGIHLCIFPETPLWDVEKSLRLAAYHKFNVAVIECWGVFPFRSHPSFYWSDNALDRNDFKHIIALGKELGITLIPQFNLLGHATGARSITGKHSILDYAPAFQPLFEPEGWSWCLSNPHTRQVLTDLVLELVEFFDTPPYFHLGCDEAHDLGSCASCRKLPLKDLVRDHITYFHDLLKERGIQSIMWHDMLLNSQDPRWKGYIACGNPDLEVLCQELPKDIIIADWQYSAAPADPPASPWPTMRFFKDQGFRVLGCPWLETTGIQSIGQTVAQEHLFGMLETSWHLCHGMQHLHVFGYAAQAAWNPAKLTDPGRFAMAHHTRQIGWDMKVDAYEETGWNLAQMDPGYIPCLHEWMG